MHYTKREVTILQVLKSSTFVKMNVEVYGGTGRLLGSSKHAELKLLANAPLLKTILPTVVGMDANSGTWQDHVQKYLYAFEVDIPKGGKTLNVGFSVNFENEVTKRNIIALGKARNETFKTEEEVAKYLIGYTNGKANISEINMYKYVEVDNPLDYYRYIYALYHNRVANVHSQVDNSPRIGFYLVSEIDKLAVKRNRYELEQAVRKVMNKVEADKEFEAAIYSVLNITTGDAIDKAIAFSEMAKVAPAKVVKAAREKHLMIKAKIENYIRAGILQRTLGSTMIVESNDPSVIIGQTMDSAITFFSNQDNNAKLTQYVSAYKSLIK